VGMSGRLDGWRVLVVEDEAMIAVLIEGILEDAGCSIVGPVSTVGGALETIERERFDVAVLDVSVNGCDVYPVADFLTANDVPVVFVSGFSRQDMPSRFRRHAHLTKPFEPDAMLAILADILGRTSSEGGKRAATQP